MTETFRKLAIQWNFNFIYKGNYKKTTAKTTLGGEILQAFLIRSIVW